MQKTFKNAPKFNNLLLLVQVTLCSFWMEDFISTKVEEVYLNQVSKFQDKFRPFHGFFNFWLGPAGENPSV